MSEGLCRRAMQAEVVAQGTRAPKKLEEMEKRHDAERENAELVGRVSREGVCCGSRRMPV